MKSILFFIAFAISTLCLSQTYQHHYRSAGNGNWNSASSWEYSNDGLSWGTATNFPGQTGNTESTTVLIECGHTITFSQTYEYTKVGELVVKGRLQYGGMHIQITFLNSPLNDFFLDIDGGYIFFYNQCLLQLPNNTVLSIHGISCSSGTVGFGSDNCNAGQDLLKIGNVGYNCKKDFPGLNDGNGAPISSLPSADPDIVCYYDNTTKPKIVASYMNYTGTNNVNYELSLISTPIGSGFDFNLVLNKTGTLNNNNTQKVIDLNQSLNAPGDYVFSLKVSTGTGGNTKTGLRSITIKKGDSVVFENGVWDVNKGEPTLFNGLTAIINDNYNTNTFGSFSACSCEVKPGKTLTIGSNNYVALLDRIKNEGNVIVENDGNLIQINDSAENIGNVEVRKVFNISAEHKQYNYVSVPVVDPSKDVKSTIYSPNPTSVQKYNTGTDYFDETVGLYISGIGYAVKESPGSPDFGQFTGTPFNGVLPYTLKTNGNRYNLVGNPYPSNIDINMLYKDNEDNIGNSFYFWDNRNNGIFNQQGSGYSGVSYAIYDALTGTGVPASTGENQEIRIPSQFVKVGTGFIIQAETSVLNFSNSQRTINNTGPSFFGKGAAGNTTDVKDRYWLTMITPGGIQVTNAVVYFEGGNDLYWKDDTSSFLGADDLFTIVEGKRLAIQGKSVFSDGDVITLGYKAFKEGTHIISIYKTDGVFADGQQIYLIDKLLNRTVNLSEKSYKFLSRAGEFNDRFEIVYKPTQSSVSEPTDIVKNLINYSKVDNRIQITSSMRRISEVEVFDLSGRPLYKNSNIQSKEFNFNIKRFDRQIIIVTVKTENGEYSTRKFVN